MYYSLVAVLPINIWVSDPLVRFVCPFRPQRNRPPTCTGTRRPSGGRRHRLNPRHLPEPAGLGHWPGRFDRAPHHPRRLRNGRRARLDPDHPHRRQRRRRARRHPPSRRRLNRPPNSPAHERRLRSPNRPVVRVGDLLRRRPVGAGETPATLAARYRNRRPPS